MATRQDPLRGFNFQVSLLESSSSSAAPLGALVASTVLPPPAAGFSECSGLQATLRAEDYEEGGNNGTVLKFPTRVQWNAITLKRGVCMRTDLWDWFYGFVEGRGRRRDGVITLQDEAHRACMVWTFRRGLPTRWDGPTMNALQGQVAIESIEISHEGLTLMRGAAQIASAVRTVVGLFGR
jgi:phage tail-like protein